MTIRDLNRATDWNLPDEEANTVAGLVIHEAQTIPVEGQCFSFHGVRFEVASAQALARARLVRTGARGLSAPSRSPDRIFGKMKAGARPVRHPRRARSGARGPVDR
jgi:hypothetical protein